VSFIELVRNLFDEAANPGQTLWASLVAFRPEIVLCLTIVAILLTRMIFAQWKSSPYYLMLLGTAIALYYAVTINSFSGTLGRAMPAFDGLLLYDSFSIFMRGLLLIFAILFTTFTQISRVPDQDDSAEFYVLVLGALVGMSLMVAANHLVIILVGMEMASLPSYVLAGLLRNRRQSSEAALKYAVYGAGAAGIMLFGMSLLAGVLGSVHLPTMARRLAELLESGGGGDRTMVLVDVRPTPSARAADIFVQVRPGRDFEVLTALRALVKQRPRRAVLSQCSRR